MGRSTSAIGGQALSKGSEMTSIYLSGDRIEMRENLRVDAALWQFNWGDSGESFQQQQQQNASYVSPTRFCIQY